MGTFVDRVRQGDIPQPTQRPYTAKAWREEFEAIVDADAQDKELFDAGLIVDRILAGLRQKLTESRFQSATRADRLKAICGLINHDTAVLKKKIDEELEQLEPGSTVSTVDLSEQTVTLRSGIKVTPDQLITTLIDSAVFPLDDALQSRDVKSPSPVTLDDVGLAFVIANQYRLASELWSSCVWGEKVIEHDASANRVIIRVRNTAEAKQVAVSQHRNETIQHGATHHALGLWRERLTLAAKKALVIEKGVTAYTPDKRSRFRIEKLDLHRRKRLPGDVHRWLMALEGYLSPFVRLALPSAQRLTVERINQVAQVLATLVRAVLAKIPEQPTDFDWFLAHAISLQRSEICDVLLRTLALDEGTANAAIEFLTYQPRSDGLWQKPLIPAGTDQFLIASAPLLYGNTLRTAERWLRQGGFDLTKRGPVFEQDARHSIAEMFRRSHLLRDAAVAPETVFVGPDREEVDLLVRIGKVLLVGEAKCQLYPVDAIEEYRFRQRLLEGAQQAVRKSGAVRAHPNDVRGAVGLSELETLVVLPFVLSNSVLHSGYPIGGVPVVDLVYLGTLLRDGGLRMGVVSRRGGEVDPGFFRQYYEDQADAEKQLADLLMRQPVVEIFAGLIQERTRPMPISAEGIEIYERYFAVSADDNPWDWESSTSVQ
jgi:hypothetical protein